ncbi:MAG: T9SS type A sorting domain-containing protein [Bacteroidota bacterium]
MKIKLLLLFALSLVFSASHAQVMWDNFEDQRNAIYYYRDGDLSVIDNPLTNGVNPSPRCGRYVRNPDAVYDVIRIGVAGTVDDVRDYVNGRRVLTMMVYSRAAGIPVQLSLEDTAQTTPTNFPTGRYGVLSDTTKTANQWELLTFHFVTHDGYDPIMSTEAVNVMLLSFDANSFVPSQTGSTYFFDNLQGFEYTLCLPTYGQYMIENFDNIHNQSFGYRDGLLEQGVPNIIRDAVNPSPFVARYTRNSNVYDVLCVDFLGHADSLQSYVSGCKKFTLKVRTDAPTGTAIDFVMQNKAIALTNPYPAGRHSVYRGLVTSNDSSRWQVITFEVSQIPEANVPASSIDEIALEFTPGVTYSSTWIFDDIAGPKIITDGAAVTKEFLWEDFGSNRHINYYNVDGPDGVLVVDNPNPSPVNAGDSCGKYTRSTVQYDVIACGWNGYVHPLADLASYLENRKKWSMQAYGPAGTTIQFTLQDSALVNAPNYPMGRYGEFVGVISQDFTWENVVLTCTKIPDATVATNNVTSLAILVNSGVGNPVTVHLDSIYGPAQYRVQNAVKGNIPKVEFLCWPVPAANELNVGMLQTTPSYKIDICDINGKTLIHHEAANTGFGNKQVISTAGLTPGVYFCRVNTPTGSSTQKFTVMR